MNTDQLANPRAHDPILDQCLTWIETYLEVPQIIPHPLDTARDDTPYDFRLKVKTKPPLDLLAVLRRHRLELGGQIRHMTLAAQGLELKHGLKLIFFAPWIRDEWAEELRRAKVFYADAQGNAFIRIPPRIHVAVQGIQPTKPIRAEPGRLIEASGLKVIHLFLTQPGFVNKPYRVIAENAAVALGTVAVVMREIRAAGYLVPQAKDEYKVERRTDLIDLFIRGYALKLRPDCLLGRFRHQEKNIDVLAARLTDVLNAGKAQWAYTGGHAAAVLTRHLRPDTLALFVDEQGRHILRREPLLPDPLQGNLTLLRFFAPTLPGPKDHVATPLLVYAELLNDDRPRELETARMIYETSIAKAEHGR